MIKAPRAIREKERGRVRPGGTGGVYDEEGECEGRV